MKINSLINDTRAARNYMYNYNRTQWKPYTLIGTVASDTRSFTTIHGSSVKVIPSMGDALFHMLHIDTRVSIIVTDTIAAMMAGDKT